MLQSIWRKDGEPETSDPDLRRQPADTGYRGTEAEADLRGIKKEYARQNIVLFAAAIGEDKDAIQRIYQEGFLDITRLDDLPKNLTLLVKQYLK